VDECVEVRSTSALGWISVEPALQVRIVEPEAVVIEARVLVPFLAGETHRIDIGQRATQGQRVPGKGSVNGIVIRCPVPPERVLAAALEQPRQIPALALEIALATPIHDRRFGPSAEQVPEFPVPPIEAAGVSAQ
jgi:hypothetical protein